MHRITTAPVAPIPARTRWAVAAGAGAALAAAWWLGDTAPYPYAQRGLLDVPLPFLTAGRMDAVLRPRPGERMLEIGPGPACSRCTSPRSSGRRDGSMCSTSSRRCSTT
ncbi:hypothetical protein ACWDZX_13720 [Streptomyces collinus]